MKDTRLKIGVDIDGVLSNFISKYREICMGICRHDLPHESIDWNQTNWNLEKKEHDAAWDVIKNTHNFYEDLDMLPGASLGSMFRLHRSQRLFFVTTRPPTVGSPIEIQSAQWLRDKFVMQFPTVIVADNKGPVAKGLGLDAFIDDKPENLLDIHEYNPDTKLYVRSQAWNSSFSHPFVTRVSDFDTFANSVDGYGAKLQEINGRCFR